MRIRGFGAVLLAVVFSACTSTHTGSQASATTDVSSFDLQGWRLIGCCCASPCPCRINEKPMRCHGCDHTDVVHVDKGYLGATDMSGVTWTIVGRGFGEDPSGNWVYVYVSDNASDAQFKALGDMLNADVKSWGDKAPHLAGKFVGMRKVPMKTTLSTDGLGYACKIPGILDLETRAIVNPGRTTPVRSEGIMDAWGDSFTQCHAVKHTFNDASINYSWDLTGLQANFAPFHLTPEKKAAGGGWGCWTAHTQFGDTAPYQEQLHDHK
jgi:hypothetical protein